MYWIEILWRWTMKNNKLFDFMDLTDSRTTKQNENKVLLIDADLLSKNAQHPNLALMKLSGYYKKKGFDTELLLDYNDDYINYPKIFMSRAFENTKVPIPVDKIKNLEYGGTGFFFDKAPDLSPVIEHSMPDYSLYDGHVANMIKAERRKSRIIHYTDFSLGFMTRGCFRKCDFCVNKKYDRVSYHAPLEEFYDPTRKAIRLWDDNVLGFGGWEKIFTEIGKTNKPFEFKQGMDCRLLNEKKCDVITTSRYIQSSFIFAFDDWDDRAKIEPRMKLFVDSFIKNRGATEKSYYAKMYVLTAYKSQDPKDLWEAFKRINVMIRWGVVPYVMKYNDYKNNKWEMMYQLMSSWTNAFALFLKMSFYEFLEMGNYSPAKRAKINELMKELKEHSPDFEIFWSEKFSEVRER